MNSERLMNKTALHDKHKPLPRIYIIAFGLITIFFLGYFYYYYYYKLTSNNDINVNSSYYGENILLYEPLFNETASNIEDCINMCKNDVICDGITYNNDTNICLGTKNGILRNENKIYSAWIKPIDINKHITTDFEKAILIGYTRTYRNVIGEKLQMPYMIGHFSFSFNIIIYDFNKNYGYWRHILHKGTKIENNTVLNYQSWENLIKDIPNQCIGVWLAPFNNNMRIAITTNIISNKNNGHYEHAFVNKCDNDECYITDLPNGKWIDKEKGTDGSIPNNKLNQYIEYFEHDLQNIPINTNINILINFRNNNAEIYFNGKIIKITQLEGTPIFDKSNLYTLQNKSVNCELSNVLYYPDSLTIEQINTINNIKPSTE